MILSFFRIYGRFDLMEDFKDDEEMNLFYFTICNLFASHLITKENSDGEKRLSAPKGISGMKFSSLVKVDFANKILKYNFFAVDILNDAGELVFFCGR